MSDESHYTLPKVRQLASPRRVLVAILALLAGAPGVDAAVRQLGASSDPRELTHGQILEHLYGGSFLRSGTDFSNGSVDAKRIDDRMGAEQIFRGELLAIKAVAAFSRNTQTLGTVEGDGFRPLLTPTGIGLNASGTVTLTGADLSETIFALQSDGKVVPSTETGGGDPLMTYVVTGQEDPRKTFLMFWEDAKAPYADFDYNDLVVELGSAGGDSTGSAAVNVIIPLPAAVWSGLSVIGALAALAGLRRLRHFLA